MSKENIKLKILDDLLAEGIHITGAKELTSYINRNLPLGIRRIGQEQAEKLLYELRKLVRAKGVAILWSSGGGYRYSLQEFRYFDDMVSEKEKNLLIVANSLFSVFSGSGMRTELSIVINKILKKKNRKGEIKDLEYFTPISLGPTVKDIGSKWIPKIIEAMKENEAIDIIYENPNDKPSERTLSPYIIKQHANSWYLVAFDHFTPQKDKTKVFKISRISKLESSGVKFKNDPDFSAEDYFKYTIGILHSHLDKPIKTEIQITSNHLFESWKEMPLHASQIILDESKKIIQIETYKTNELFSLLLRHGASIKVLSPNSLAKELKAKLLQNFKQYD
jgi:predicted DNA-binding transcriptional regulator YafY